MPELTDAAALVAWMHAEYLGATTSPIIAGLVGSLVAGLGTVVGALPILART